MYWDNANRKIPVSHKYPPGDWTRVPNDEKQMDGPLELCMNAVRLQALHKNL